MPNPKVYPEPKEARYSGTHFKLVRRLDGHYDVVFYTRDSLGRAWVATGGLDKQPYLSPGEMMTPEEQLEACQGEEL